MVEIEVRDELDQPLPPGENGMIYLRGEQISGEYATGSLLDDAGWFCTRDRGMVDEAGYLFIEGRSDDTIIRGGENIAPAEIEEVLLAHDAVAEVCVVGVPDEEWGQRIVAAVVLREGEDASADDLREAVRSKLRSSEDAGGDRVPHRPPAHRDRQDAAPRRFTRPHRSVVAWSPTNSSNVRRKSTCPSP